MIICPHYVRFDLQWMIQYTLNSFHSIANLNSEAKQISFAQLLLIRHLCGRISDESVCSLLL